MFESFAGVPLRRGARPIAPVAVALLFVSGVLRFSAAGAGSGPAAGPPPAKAALSAASGAAAGVATPGAAAPSGPEAIAALAWLAGSWSGDEGGLAMEEHWTVPAGGALLGLHRDVKNGRMVSFEFLRIGASAETVTYWASPRSAPPTPFRLKELGPGRRVVFENPEHDFPQRILYWMGDDDALHARIEGPTGTGEKAMEWTWRRASS